MAVDNARKESVLAAMAGEAGEGGGEGGGVPKRERRRRSATSGLSLKLEAPGRAGFVRRWVDNHPARVLAMQELGYDLAGEKAGEGAARTDGLGARIERLGGRRESGEPQHLVLMETPADEYGAGATEKEDQLKPFEDAIRRSADTTGRLSNAYEPRDRSSLTHSA